MTFGREEIQRLELMAAIRFVESLREEKWEEWKKSNGMETVTVLFPQKSGSIKIKAGRVREWILVPEELAKKSLMLGAMPPI